MIWYVNASANEGGNGSKETPFRTIQEAAELAEAGDQVRVGSGIYREYVNPKHGGKPDARIEYISEEPLAAIITGAEEAKGWEKINGSVWKLSVPNDLFGDYNPYTTLVRGDWYNAERKAHTGDVYLNHKSMYEVDTPSGVFNPQKSKSSWDSDFSLYTWCTSQNSEADCTELLANFGKYDPNKEDVEIAVRQDCFLPSAEGLGYITLSGFTVREAATQWAPPTAYQDGMIGPHWSKGWIIEDCEIYESKCSGISLGKYLQPNNNNKWLEWKYKDGTQTERDCICQASYEGWDKEHIGSHIIRRCNIHHCGQTGIVGHLGGVFSIIEDNHIHHINNKVNLEGFEIGGIKMHAAIDVIIRRNHIHYCTRGIWLDWQAQGTRVTGNLMHDNALPFDINAKSAEDILPYSLSLGEDIFVEVSHGPTLIDNNFLLSDRSLRFCSQGIAVVHNLIGGSLAAIGTGVNNGSRKLPSPRYTPYHAIHGTAVAGFMTILHGDVRFYNNIFVQNPDIDSSKHTLNQVFELIKFDGEDVNFTCGTFKYDGFPTQADWEKMFEGYCGTAGIFSENKYPDKYYEKLPVWYGGNHYFNGAKPAKNDKGAYSDQEHVVKIAVINDKEAYRIETNLYDYLPKNNTSMVNTDMLGMAFEPEMRFENPNGSSITFDTDYTGAARPKHPTAGPLQDTSSDIISAIHSDEKLKVKNNNTVKDTAAFILKSLPFFIHK